MAIQAFVTSRIDYCNAALLGLSWALIDRVQCVTNSAARLLLKLQKILTHICSYEGRAALAPCFSTDPVQGHSHDVEVYRWVCAGLSARSLPPTFYNLRTSIGKRDPPWQVVSCSKFHEPELWQCREGFSPMQDRPCGTICLRQFVRPLCLSAQIQLKNTWKPSCSPNFDFHVIMLGWIDLIHLTVGELKFGDLNFVNWTLRVAKIYI